MTEELGKQLNEARAHLDKNAPDLAESICREILVTQKDHAPTWNLLGITAYQKKNLDESISCHENALLYDADNVSYMRDLGMALIQNGDLKKARSTLEKCQSLKPELETLKCLREVEIKEYLLKENSSGKTGDTKKKKFSIKKNAQPKVAIYSWTHISNNFGDRFPYHLAPMLFPANWELNFYGITPYDFNNLKKYDLVILGMGNSIFHEVLRQEDFLDFFSTANKLVGIFGTQFRPLIDKEIFGSLIGQLDYWFARYKDDIEIYGKDVPHASHLGDWLISLFPVSRWTDKGDLILRNEHICNNNMPLDRLMQHIQKWRRVSSPRVHTLLCALCSAEYARYQEERDHMHNGEAIASGKFRSMLSDVFNKNIHEDEWFKVNREIVIKYKTDVRSNMARMRKKIIELVG